MATSRASRVCGLAAYFCAAGLATAALSDLPAGNLGDPLAGLSKERSEQFADGQQVFLQVKSVDQGLGPYFNDRSCGGCHGVPVAGGGGKREQNVIVRLAAAAPGGSAVVPARTHQRQALPGYEPEPISPHDRISQRLAPPLFGLGLIEALPEAVILAHEDPRDQDGDGISGRAHRINGAVSRFGWKAQIPTLFDFVYTAYGDELGITSPFMPHDRHGDGRAADGSLPPESNARDIYNLAGFIRFLAPPGRSADPHLQDSIKTGEQLFQTVGCAQCHLPVMNSGTNVLQPLSEVDVPLYSDLLLHNMGLELDDGVPQGDATSSEWRTAPLWGLTRTHTAYLHDGRARTMAEAIRLHGGEATRARDGFLRLAAKAQQALLRFLASL